MLLMIKVQNKLKNNSFSFNFCTQAFQGLKIWGYLLSSRLACCPYQNITHVGHVTITWDKVNTWVIGKLLLMIFVAK